MMKPDLFQAVLALVGGSLSYDATSKNFTYHDGQIPPTEEAIQAKLKELQAEYEANQYQRERKEEYPSVEECIHAILDNDLETLQAKRSAVKAKYPKPK